MINLSLMSQGAISITQAWQLPTYIRERYMKIVHEHWKSLQKMYQQTSHRCPLLGK